MPRGGKKAFIMNREPIACFHLDRLVIELQAKQDSLVECLLGLFGGIDVDVLLLKSTKSDTDFYFKMIFC